MAKKVRALCRMYVDPSKGLIVAKRITAPLDEPPFLVVQVPKQMPALQVGSTLWIRAEVARYKRFAWQEDEYEEDYEEC